MSVQGNDRTREGFSVVGATIELGDVMALREIAEQLRDHLQPAVVMLGSKNKDGRALLVCSVSNELTTKINAGELIRTAASVIGGEGGGRPDFAQAGGSDVNKVDDAVSQIHSLVGAINFHE